MKALLLAALLFIASSMTVQAAPRGDVTGDGKTDVVDAMFVLQYTHRLRSFTPAQYRLCNMDKDKKCTREDAQLILDYDVSPQERVLNLSSGMDCEVSDCGWWR